MLESGFIALMGILSGVVGGVIISRNLFTTGQFAGEGVEFMMPWTEVLLFNKGPVRNRLVTVGAEAPGSQGARRELAGRK